MVSEQNILNALRHIIDPDFKKDIVSLGFVRNIQIGHDRVALEIALTTPACPVKDDFKKAAEDALKNLPGIRHVDVTMTSQPMTKEAAGIAPVKGMENIRSIIAVSSAKGGVGKSTIAAALASDLADRGFRVGLLDADIHGPSVPTLFNLTSAKVFVNKEQKLLPVEVNKLKVMSFGFLLGDAPAVMRGPIISRYIQQLLTSVEWGTLDYLFIDMPPGTGDVQLTITQSLRLTGAVIVTTRQTLSLVDVARGILMFERVNVPILGVIENMAYFQCDQCDKKHYIFGGDGGRDAKSCVSTLEDRFGIKTLAEIPIQATLSQKFDKPLNDPNIQKAVDQVVRAIGRQSIAETAVPEIKFDAQNVYLKWKDGRQATIANRDLRASCECALCINEMTGERILDTARIKPDIAPKEIFPLGNYALAISWNDGHASGIYPYKNILQTVGS